MAIIKPRYLLMREFTLSTRDLRKPIWSRQLIISRVIGLTAMP